MSGRKPMGPGLVQNLNGSDQAKGRLEVMLESLFDLPVAEACERLGIGEAMLHRLRTRALQGALDTLEPRPRGRPKQPQDDPQLEALQAEIKQLQEELKISEVKREIDLVLPQVSSNDDTAEDVAQKKTRRRRKNTRQRQRRR